MSHIYSLIEFARSLERQKNKSDARLVEALEKIASQIEDGYNEYYVKTAKQALTTHKEASNE